MSDLLIAFSLGLFSAPHCFAMCGSIASALVMGSQNAARSHDTFAVAQVWPNTETAQLHAPRQHATATVDAFTFASGKLFSYALLGFFAGTLSAFLALAGPLPGIFLRGISALLMIAIGFYIAGWWKGISRLESLVNKLWQPALKKINGLRLDRVSRKLMAGAIWGFLPCGIVYSMLGLSLSSGGPLHGMAMMASFGLGTIPFVMGTGGMIGVIGKVLANPVLRNAAGTAVIILGLVSLAMLVIAQTGHSPMPLQHEVTQL